MEARMAKTLAAIAVVLVAALAFPPALAECEPSQSDALVIRTFRGVHYLVVENTPCEGCTGVDLHGYLYEEGNDQPGLQRHDSGRDNTCGGLVEPDRQLL
jgi:hypothetical protein